LEMAPRGPLWLLAGYFLMHGINRFLTAFVCDTPRTSNYALGLIPLLGIGLHSFIDGIIYSVSFTVSLYTGALVAIGMVLHELPEGIITYALLVRSGFTTRQSFFLSFAAAAATTPLGAAASYPFIASIGGEALGSLLALSAGALIYVGATHLLPYSEREPRRFSAIALASGVVVALGIVVTDI